MFIQHLPNMCIYRKSLQLMQSKQADTVSYLFSHSI